MQIDPQWVTFYLAGKEIVAISIDGLFPDEIEETAKLLAYEKGVTVDLIQIGTR